MQELELTENARQVLESRYLRRDSSGAVVETPRAALERVARAVAEAELELGSARQAARWENTFRELLLRLDFLPNSPTLMNAGTRSGQLAACFVLPIEDTTEDVFETLKQMALLERTGAGTGFSFSRLRPAGDALLQTGGEASGPVAFMRVIDGASEHVRHSGRRRGLHHGGLRIDHPDILAFAAARRPPAPLKNFRLSVGVTDAFLDAVRADRPFALVHPRTGEPLRELRARNLLEVLARSALETGDPGLLFLDVINASHRTPALGALETTSPGGEVALLPFESCTLGSINLARMLEGPPGAERVAWARLGETVRHAIRFLDDAIEVTRFPLPALEQAARAVRKIGLGVMGYAELLIRLGLPYGSTEAMALASRLMAFIRTESDRASAALAEERGVFPAWEASVFARSGRRLRNATLTAVAATGNLSAIVGTTPSIEPLTTLTCRRVQQPGAAAVMEVHPLLRRHLDRLGGLGAELLAGVLEHGHLGALPQAPEALRRLFVTARELEAETHLAVQAAFQGHVDNAVSKTVMLPLEATIEDCASVFLRARELGLKSVSISRAESVTDPARATGRLGEDEGPGDTDRGLPTAAQPVEELHL